MKKLIIKKPGIFMNIPGITPFRTPAKIDISKVDIKLIISCLNRNGISEYEVEDDEEVKIKDNYYEIIEPEKIVKEKVKEINNNLLSRFLDPNFKISDK